jgi:hypothetical protein
MLGPKPEHATAVCNLAVQALCFPSQFRCQPELVATPGSFKLRECSGGSVCMTGSFKGSCHRQAQRVSDNVPYRTLPWYSESGATMNRDAVLHPVI